MDEDTALINSSTRNEKIKNFFIKNKKSIISVFIIIVLILLGYFALGEYKERKRVEISDEYNSIIMKYSEVNKENTKKALVELVRKKDPTYSPLSLFFIIDKALISDQTKINDLFNIIIDDVSLENEIKNLIIYKKALYNADKSEENQLLDIVKPIINSESVWKSHGLYLMAEFFYSKNEKEKAKEFFRQIISLENANEDLRAESQKRLSRDLSE
tara:strand:- start:235 stop:879 length:645 start_codon:yes stop_codon:yes gene_type:complete